RWLSGADDHALDVAATKPLAKDGKLGDGGVGEHVHRTAGHIENEMQNIVFAAFRAELLQLSQYRHDILRGRISRYSIPYICVLVQTNGFCRDRKPPKAMAASTSRERYLRQSRWASPHRWCKKASANSLPFIVPEHMVHYL